MGYQTGMLKHRVKILKRVQTASKFSAAGGPVSYVPIKEVWAGYQFNKGAKSLREGALDAYDTVMFYFHASVPINRNNYIGHKGRVYQITSFNDEYADDKIQITAVEIVGKIADVPSSGNLETNEQVPNEDI